MRSRPSTRRVSVRRTNLIVGTLARTADAAECPAVFILKKRRRILDVDPEYFFKDSDSSRLH